MKSKRLPRKRPSWKRISIAILAVMLVMLALVSTAVVAQLTGSDFEIDDGNLVVDGSSPSIDWLEDGANSPLRNGVDLQVDVPSGQDDDALGQGSKEDDDPPRVISGSVPKNKSDLKAFGVYTERNELGNFLHLFWTRVQDPSGTTLMDFEFNQSTTLSTNGVTPERTVGDLLVTYELAQGGTVPSLFLYEWLGSSGDGDCEASNKYPCWGNKAQLDASGAAEGSINSQPIPASDSGGLGALDPRTFGEASIDLSIIFDQNACQSFGSAYLKSRSSDSFTAALKDFIAPLGVNLSNCGTVKITKETDPSPDPRTTSFEYVNDLVTEDGPYGTFYLEDGDTETIVKVLAGDYDITESDPDAAGFDLTAIDCSKSDVEVETDLENRQVSFTMAVDATVDCTFTNTLRRGSITVVKETAGGDGKFDFTSSTLDDFGLTTVSGTASKKFTDLIPGTFDVAETVPDGWYLDPEELPYCDDGSDPGNIGLDPGEDVICTFANVKKGKILVDKVTDPAGSAESFDFTLSGGPDSLDDDFSLTDVDDPRASGDIKPGTYAVEETKPTGWTLDGATCAIDGGDPFDYTNGADLYLGAGQTIECTFHNSTGAILISKTAKDAAQGAGPHPLEGATFEVKFGEKTVATATTDTNGEACVGGLIVGAEYTVTETDAPSGYDFDDTAQTVVAAAAECDGEGTPAGVSFENVPLSEIEVIFRSLAGPGITQAIITCEVCEGDVCTEMTLDSGTEDEDEIYTKLLPGTYDCTIVIDP